MEHDVYYHDENKCGVESYLTETNISCRYKEKLKVEEKGILTIPIDIYHFSNLKVLYFLLIPKHLSLYGNKISLLPDVFFDSFPCLNWLDLRRNQLITIPRKILKLRKLTHFLIGHNLLKRLCIEIGGLPSLVSINIGGNPLEFPTSNIVCRGSHYALKYLRSCYALRCALENRSGTLTAKNSKPSWETANPDQSQVKFSVDHKIINNTNVGLDGCLLNSNNHLDAIAIAHIDNEVAQQLQNINNKAVNQGIYKSKKHERISSISRKSVASKRGLFYLTKQSQRHALALQTEDKLISNESVQKSSKRCLLRMRRKFTIANQDAILQRFKNQEAMDKWKTGYRYMRYQTASIYLEKTVEQIKEESLNRIQRSPFEISADATVVIPVDELSSIKMGPRPAIKPDPLPRPRSVRSVLQLERERRHKDKLLIDEVTEQVEALNAKMGNPCLPKSLIDAEMDLVKALKLQMRLRERHDVLSQLKPSTNPLAFL